MVLQVLTCSARNESQKKPRASMRQCNGESLKKVSGVDYQIRKASNRKPKELRSKTNLLLKSSRKRMEARIWSDL